MSHRDYQAMNVRIGAILPWRANNYIEVVSRLVKWAETEGLMVICADRIINDDISINWSKSKKREIIKSNLHKQTGIQL